MTRVSRAPQKDRAAPPQCACEPFLKSLSRSRVVRPAEAPARAQADAPFAACPGPVCSRACADHGATDDPSVAEMLERFVPSSRKGLTKDNEVSAANVACSIAGRPWRVRDLQIMLGRASQPTSRFVCVR